MVKILIVEDDQFYLKIYRKKFETEGFQVETATDGEDGLAKMKTFSPNIVLLDIMMPKMDGFDVLEAVAADATLKKIPIVMMSNLSTQEDVDKATEKGAIGYIVKSDYTPSQVVVLIKEHIEGRHSAPAKPAAPKAA